MNFIQKSEATGEAPDIRDGNGWRHPLPELAKAETPGEFLATYETLLQNVTDGHRQRLEPIVPTYTAMFRQEFADPGSHDIPNIFDVTSNATARAIAPTAAELGQVLQAAADITPHFLDEKSQHHLEVARELMRQPMVSPDRIRRRLRMAPSSNDPMIHNLLMAGLDARIFDAVCRDVKEAPLSLLVLTGSRLSLVSIDAARDAMRAALDRSIRGSIQRVARHSGLGSPVIKQYLDNASTPEARAVMQTVFAREAFRSANEVMNNLLMETRFPRDDRMAWAEADLDRIVNRTVRTVLRRHFGFEPVDTGQDGQTLPTATAIVNSLTEAHRQYRWLNTQLPEVERIIDEIRAARVAADKAGIPVSDRDIYLSYRRAAEADPRKTGDVQIVEALMGGNLGGEFLLNPRPRGDGRD